MGSEPNISGFVSDVFVANTANNFMLECTRASQSKICDELVGLEPAFEPFDAVKTYRKINDFKLVTPAKEVGAEWFVCGLKIPLGDEIPWERFDALLSSLSNFGGVASFEICCINKQIIFLVGSNSKDFLNVLCNAWQAFFPELVFIETQDYFCQIKSFEGELSLFDLYSPPPYHRRIICDKIVGSISSLLKTFSLLKAGECGFFQTIYTPARNNWGLNIKSLLKAEAALGARSPYGVSVSSSVKDVSKPIFASAVRFGCVTKNNTGVIGGLGNVAGCFLHEGKSLLFRTQKDYVEAIGKNKILEMLGKRLAYSSGMLLCSDELSGFVHLPDRSILNLGLVVDVAKGFKPTERLLSGRPLGFNTATGKKIVVCLPDDERNKGMWMLGASRMGKSTSITHQMLHLASSGSCGVGLVDPHRTTAQETLGLLPEGVLSRVVFVDFDDEECVIDFNPFDEQDKESYGRLSVEAVNSLKNLFEAGSFYRMSHILRMCVYALFVLKKNLSIIPLLLSRNAEGAKLRREVSEKTDNEEVKRFWQTEYSAYRDDAFAPILNRLSTLFADDRALRIFSREKNKLNIKQIMDEGRILIVALPSSVDTSNLIGGLLISQFQKCALARTARQDSIKTPFFLIVDEFHRFSTGRIIESIINETVKAGLHLCVANQETGQLSEELLMAVLSMPNIMLFNVNYLDAKKLSPIFCGKVSPEEIVSLKVGECFAKISGEIIDFVGFPPKAGFDAKIKERIVGESRRNYCTPIKNLAKKQKVAVVSRNLDTF